MEMADHRPDRYRELAGLYLAQTAQHLQALGEALAAGALPEARRLAHKCTGASATCGMVSMLQPLEAVERLSAEGRPQEANRALAEAGHTLERLRHCLTDHWNSLSVSSQEKLAP